MALSGIEIYKLLPSGSKNPAVKAHANCKECGFPTCLAFAMKLAQKQADLAQCPYVEDESKASLEASAAPPIRLISLPGGAHTLDVGNETVLFRHERTFVHQPGIFVRVKDSQPDAREVARAVAEYTVDYVGKRLMLDGVAVEAKGGDYESAVAAVTEVCSLPLILLADDPSTAEAGLRAAQGRGALLYAANADNWEVMASLASRYGVPLVVRDQAGDLGRLISLAEQVKAAGVENLVFDPGAHGHRETLAAFTQLRRLAIKKNDRRAGYPIIAFAGDDPLLATQFVAKYAGFIVLDHFDPAQIYPLLVLRANLFTDPQKPIQVQPGLYEINNPDPNAPVLVTTNFSITYFAVANEVESSGLSAWLVVVDAEGMSVLTGWAAGKFDAERISKSIGAFSVADKVAHRSLIIPGLVAVLSGEIEECLPGWEVRVGPREAVDLPNYLKSVVGVPVTA